MPWLPGFIACTLCFTIVIFFRILPETRGKELPQSLEDVDSWTEGQSDAEIVCNPEEDSANVILYCRKIARGLTKSVKKAFCSRSDSLAKIY